MTAIFEAYEGKKTQSTMQEEKDVDMACVLFESWLLGDQTSAYERVSNCGSSPKEEYRRPRHAKAQSTAGSQTVC